MTYAKDFRITPGTRVNLDKFDPSFTNEHENKHSSLPILEKYKERIDLMQYRLYAEKKQSILICLQAPDTGGKDGVIRHVLGSMNPQGCRVVGFKEPSTIERAHDFLWRIEAQTPSRGEVVVFNRSHYEDILIVRVHDLVPKKTWIQRYDQINAFERCLIANGTHILKFFLNISKEEQLERFKDRLDDPERHWKISEADYSERKYWDEYKTAYEDVLSRCSTDAAPWYVIPSDHKWFRNLAISQIIAETIENLGIEIPKPTVDIADIKKKYFKAHKKSTEKKGRARK